jgi:uncharacterized protein (DUF4415 family)
MGDPHDGEDIEKFQALTKKLATCMSNRLRLYYVYEVHPMSEKNMNKHTKTNLDRFDAMTDDMIDTSDIPELTEEFFASAKWRMPKEKVKLTVEVEPEVAQWFKAQGDNYQRLLEAALRIYSQAHRE